MKHYIEVDTSDSVAAVRSSPDVPPGTTDPSRKTTIDPSSPVWEISTRLWVGAGGMQAFYRNDDILFMN